MKSRSALIVFAASAAMAFLLAWTPAPSVNAALPQASNSSSDKLEFSEKQVAGGPGDFMIVRHLRMRGSNRAIGWKLAEIARTRHGVEPNGEVSDATKDRWSYYRKSYPTHYQRALGVADAFSVPPDGAVDCMALIFNMDVAPGCSVVYYPPRFTAIGHPILSRNYDFTTATWGEFTGRKSPPGARPCTADPYVIEVYPDQGYASLYICAYDLLGGCLDGINARGLTVALLANHEESGGNSSRPSNGWRPGISEIEIARYVLDRCGTVDEARQALASVDYYYSWIPCHYIIGDAAGRSFVWEYALEDGARHATDGDGKPQIITNHPVYRYRSADDLPPGSTGPHTFARYRKLSESIATAAKARSIDDMKAANASVAACAPSSRKPGRTLWHALYDCKDLTLEADFYLGEDDKSPGKQRRSGYVKFQLDARPPAGN